MVPLESLSMVFLFAFYSNWLRSLLYQFRDKARYWLKIAIFRYTLYSTPRLAGLRLVAWKSTVVCLPDGEKCLMIGLAISIEYRRVTDGRADARTG